MSKILVFSSIGNIEIRLEKVKSLLQHTQGDVLILTQNTHKHIHSHLLKSCNGSQVLWGSFVPKGGACFQARVAILPASTVLIVTITSVSGQVKTD